MKTTWKALAVVLLVAGGGIGFVASTYPSKPSVQAVAAMADTMKVSMQSDMQACEKCSGDDHSQCIFGSCNVGASGMVMAADEKSCQECSSDDHSQCTKDRCTPNDLAMVVSNSPSMTMAGLAKPAMGESMMTETRMASPTNPSMVDRKMNDKELAPKMDSGSMVDTKLQIDRKM